MDRGRRGFPRWFWKPALLGAALLAGWLVFMRSGDAGGASARTLVANGALLLDVRTPAEFAEKHLAGAVNIPVQELETRLGEVGPNKDRPVVVYCRSGRRSAHAKQILEAAGYRTVHDLGAMSSW